MSQRAQKYTPVEYNKRIHFFTTEVKKQCYFHKKIAQTKQQFQKLLKFFR